jgi:hypothetical protein
MCSLINQRWVASVHQQPTRLRDGLGCQVWGKFGKLEMRTLCERGTCRRVHGVVWYAKKRAVVIQLRIDDEEIRANDQSATNQQKPR